jgi:hypothetical protein
MKGCNNAKKGCHNAKKGCNNAMLVENVEVGILLHRHTASKGIAVYARFGTQPSLAKRDCAAFIGYSSAWLRGGMVKKAT